jgi:ribosomal protein S18 acetylase RimI-like enzyme
VTVRFYRRCGPPSEDAASGLPPDCELRIWSPRRDGLPPLGPRLGENLAWFAIDRLGLFASDGFEELSIWKGGRMAHRLVVTPCWLRFPFMAPGDLQLGGLWTAPEARRTGLATAAVAEACRRHARPGRRFWYVVDETNAASIALAEACGFRLAGTGRRTRPLGLSAIGRFELERPGQVSGGSPAPSGSRRSGLARRSISGTAPATGPRSHRVR